MSDIGSIVQNYPYQLEAAYVLHAYNAHEAVDRYPNTVGGFTLNNLANQAERIDFAAEQLCRSTTASVARTINVVAADVVLTAETNDQLGNAYDRYLEELSQKRTPAVMRDRTSTGQDPEQQLIVDALGILRGQRALITALRQAGTNSTAPIIRRSVESYAIHPKAARAIVAACDSLWLQTLTNTEPLSRATKSIYEHASGPVIASLFAAALDARVIADVRDRFSQGYTLRDVCIDTIAHNASPPALEVMLTAVENFCHERDMSDMNTTLDILSSTDTYWEQRQESAPERVDIGAYTSLLRTAGLIQNDDIVLRVFGKEKLENADEYIECILTSQHRIVRIYSLPPDLEASTNRSRIEPSCCIYLDSGQTLETIMYPRAPRIEPSYFRDASIDTKQHILAHLQRISEREG